MARYVLRHGLPVVLADDGGKRESGKPGQRTVPKPANAAVTTGEALAIFQRAKPSLTADDVADLLTRNSVPRHACWDHQTVLALADALRSGDLKRHGGSATRRLA
jgi:hypothetical protein